MDAIEFAAIVAAVILGNAISVCCAIGLSQAHRDPKSVSFPMWIGMLVGPAIVIAVGKFGLS